MSSRANYYAKTLSVCPNGEWITRSEKFVLMVLADAHQDGAHLRTYPKVATIAEDAMVSERQCQRIFASMERKGVLRREYPNGMGRDRLTFYIFPELDEQQGTFSAVKKPAKQAKPKPAEEPGNDAAKGDKMSPLFPEEGCQKGDRRVTSGAPYLNNKNNKSNKDKYTPLPPAGGCVGCEVNPAIVLTVADQVMRLCGVSNRRRKPAVILGVELALELGESSLTLAERVADAWKEHALANGAGLLHRMFGFEKFISEGKWKDQNTWLWNHEKLERQASARVGMG